MIVLGKHLIRTVNQRRVTVSSHPRLSGLESSTSAKQIISHLFLLFA
jgi:hypothetical protein